MESRKWEINKGEEGKILLYEKSYQEIPLVSRHLAVIYL